MPAVLIKKESDIDEALDRLLLDDFSVYGDDASLFAKTQKKISDNTYSFLAPMKNIRILSVLPENDQPEDGSIAMYVLDTNGISDWFFELNQLLVSSILVKDEEKSRVINNEIKRKLNKCKILTINKSAFNPDGRKAGNEELIKELKTTRLIFEDSYTNYCYIVSQLALATLGQRILVKGDAIQQPCLERDIFIAKRMKSDKNAQFIVKKHNSLGKIFMVATETYRVLSMQVIEELYHIFDGDNGIGTMRCEGWEINHSYSRIRFSFCDYEKSQDMAFFYGLREEEVAIPCIEIISSDIGDYAFTVRGFWKLRGGYLYTDEVSKKHSGNITIEDIVEETKKTIFERYHLLPERFMDLLSMDITPECVQKSNAILKSARNKVFELETGYKKLESELESAKDAGDKTAETEISGTLAEVSKEMESAKKELETAERANERLLSDHKKLLGEIINLTMKKISTTSLQYKKDWKERISNNLDPSHSYTAYDIMSIILDTQSTVKCDDTVEKMRKSMAGLPYLPYDEYKKSAIERLGLFGTRKNSKQKEETAAIQVENTNEAGDIVDDVAAELSAED